MLYLTEQYSDYIHPTFFIFIRTCEQSPLQIVYKFSISQLHASQRGDLAKTSAFFWTPAEGIPWGHYGISKENSQETPQSSLQIWQRLMQNQAGLRFPTKLAFSLFSIRLEDRRLDRFWCFIGTEMFYLPRNMTLQAPRIRVSCQWWLLAWLQAKCAIWTLVKIIGLHENSWFQLLKSWWPIEWL